MLLSSFIGVTDQRNMQGERERMIKSVDQAIMISLVGPGTEPEFWIEGH